MNSWSKFLSLVEIEPLKIFYPGTLESFFWSFRSMQNGLLREIEVTEFDAQLHRCLLRNAFGRA